jgi:hypothetical protein
MDKLIELLQQIQELAGVAVDALKGAGGEHKPGEGEPKPEGAPAEGGGEPKPEAKPEGEQRRF